MTSLTAELNTVGDMRDRLQEVLQTNADKYTDSSFYYELSGDIEQIGSWPSTINGLVDKLSAAWKSDTLLSAMLEKVDLGALKCEDNTTIGHMRDSIAKLHEYYNGVAGWHAADGDD